MLVLLPHGKPRVSSRNDSFTITFETNAGEILFPLGEPLLRQQALALALLQQCLAKNLSCARYRLRHIGAPMYVCKETLALCRRGDEEKVAAVTGIRC